MPAAKPVHAIVGRTKNSNYTLATLHIDDCAKQKSARKQPYTGLLSLALKAGMVWGLINFDFDPAVLGSTLSGRVGSDRFGFAKSLTRDPAALHTLLHYVVPHRHPTPI